MNLTDLNHKASAYKKRKRVGRGHGSGYGKTSGRGHKGLGQRSGAGRHAQLRIGLDRGGETVARVRLVLDDEYGHHPARA